MAILAELMRIVNLGGFFKKSGGYLFGLIFIVTFIVILYIIKTF